MRSTPGVNSHFLCIPSLACQRLFTQLSLELFEAIDHSIERLTSEAARELEDKGRLKHRQKLIYGLVEIGVCGEANMIEWPVSMGLCFGVDARSEEDDDREFHFNSNDFVKFHTASVGELRTVAAGLNAMLQGIDLKGHLAIVTVCRSIRDGYLPRRLVEAVETAVLHIATLLVDDPHIIIDARPTW